ncbi:hypothetical protein SAMN05421749_11150 [Acinetobacter marinus]|uniref:Uncharacterized protein n=1 Tax=Acinetobacter marinus TaxID=281375 RepID=A0A1G6P007_9GAMM|nr:hypothetical protein [Acinetobacter marinus]SDC72934.1 hypothetical protein SAMN05421749_11150 [Acinetobacter marinus]
MGQEQQKRQQKQILWAYVMMFLTVFSIVPLVIAYVLAMRLTNIADIEVWLNSHALWIVRSLLIFLCIAVFAALWFIPLYFFVWDQQIWVTACTIAGVIFALVAWLYLLNAWLKGMIKFFQRKPVY